MNKYVLHLARNNNVVKAMGVQMPICNTLLIQKTTCCPLTQIVGCKNYIIQ